VRLGPGAQSRHNAAESFQPARRPFRCPLQVTPFLFDLVNFDNISNKIARGRSDCQVSSGGGD
jgi:hypothetical protein